MARTDWGAVRLDFIHDPEKATLKQFCGKRKISYSTASKRSAREDWEAERQTHWQKVERAATEQVAEMQVGVTARDVAQKLSQIQAMKMNALKYAGGLDGADVAYEKPHEAVAAYERLEKLERLILGESTEHIRVDDARQMVSAVIQVIRDEVRDHDTLERITARLISLGPPGGGSADAHRALPN
ncbi:hypothetical protein [Deinococcus humi]|uniref:Uncharacterized protein n=1 Tax=Deinococcus humi TaxID=662880 RepID=A0A7W8JQI2_9DEIO|nr:hypothetical protein [Deinococcus humi]MBB5361342.1 hypothetical protein [Deinococcus humi]GGO19552.1 hypothetical protein GCM10008949_04060 [Deinococcus humi]